MKISYDAEVDALSITFREARIKESDEVRPGVIADFGYDGGVVGFEVLEASKVVEIPAITLEGFESVTGLLALHDKPARKYGGK